MISVSDAPQATTEHPRIVVVGDYDARIHTHRAIDEALTHVRDAECRDLSWRWLHTREVRESDLRVADGLWLAPASPYQSMDGALFAIRFAREQGTPFLGVCGGFQHAVIEFVRHCVGLESADHAEIAPDATELAIVPLKCSLVGESGVVLLNRDSRLASVYETTRIVEGYFCRYGLNARYADAIDGAGLRIVGRDEAGDARAVELRGHPFFVATLFQPQLASRPEAPAPLVRAFAHAALARATARAIAFGARGIIA